VLSAIRPRGAGRRHSRYSFAELMKRSTRQLRPFGAGVRPGDRVAATARNDPDIVIAFHAVQRWARSGSALPVSSRRRKSLPTARLQRVHLPRGRCRGRGGRAIARRTAELSAIVDMEPPTSTANGAACCMSATASGHPHRARPAGARDHRLYQRDDRLSQGRGAQPAQLLVATESLDAPEVTRQACVMQLAILNVMMNTGSACCGTASR